MLDILQLKNPGLVSNNALHTFLTKQSRNELTYQLVCILGSETDYVDQQFRLIVDGPMIYRWLKYIADRKRTSLSLLSVEKLAITCSDSLPVKPNDDTKCLSRIKMFSTIIYYSG